MRWIKHFLCILLFSATPAFGELLTAGVAIFASLLGFNFRDKIKLNTYCMKYECCHESLIPHDLVSIKDKLHTKLFGQHIIQERLFKALASHYENIEKSKKPLVMSFHGTVGTGKNYVSKMIAESIFELGTESKYFHAFHGSQYDNKDKIQEHKDQIKKEMYDAVDNCPYSIFVFDEVDKMPEGIFDSITSILEYHGLVKNKDFKKSVFIFLTNSGGEEIAAKLHQLTTDSKLYRHETKLHHFEKIIAFGVFNRKGGLKDSALIKSALIDFYFPFLPLEVKHVEQCIVEEYKACGQNDVSQGMIKDIIKEIGFDSTTNYSHTGCKTIYAKVKADCQFFKKKNK